ncbi:MAG: glycosyltransferase family 39 protein [Candidatus Sericytochromatia bacterium]
MKTPLSTRTWIWLAVGAFVLVRLGLALLVPSPYIMPDELIYLELARNLAQGHGFSFRGEPMSFPTVLFPLLLAPSQWATDPDVAFRLAQLTSGLLMLAAAVPIYRLARLMLPAGAAAAVSALAMVPPYTLYGHTVMTEGLFFLLFTATAYATVLAIAAPSRRSMIGLGAVLGLAFFAKPQGMLLTAVVVATFLATEAFRRHEAPGFARRLVAFWPAVATFGAIAALHVWRVAWENPGANLLAVSTYLGTYSGGLAGLIPFTWGHFWGAVAAIFGALALSAGFWPLALFLPFAWRALRGGPITERALVAFAAFATVLLVGLAARNVALSYPPQVVERYCFHLSPLFLVGAWLVAYRQRVPWRFGLAASAGLIGLSAWFMERATLTYVDTPAYMALYRPSLSLGWPATTGVVVALALGFVAVMAWLGWRGRPRMAWALAVLYGVTLTASSLYGQVTLSRRYDYERPFVAWVHAHTGPDQPIALVSDGLPYIPAVLTNVFSRQPIRQVYLERPMAAWLERRLTRLGDGELVELSRLPDGTRVVAHQDLALDLPVLARREGVVIYEKRGAVRLRPAG